MPRRLRCSNAYLTRAWRRYCYLYLAAGRGGEPTRVVGQGVRISFATE
jgi:hypothetical protein